MAQDTMRLDEVVGQSVFCLFRETLKETIEQSDATAL